MSDLKTAQDYLKETASGEARGGFNSRLQGESFTTCMNSVPFGREWGERNKGWTIADEMIREGKIFSVFITSDKKFYLKCYLDGNAWCCVECGFTNLQECDAVFANTQKEAIAEYISLHS